MDIAQVSMAMSAMQLQQSVGIAVQKNVQDVTTQIAQDLIAMLDVGTAAPSKLDIQV